MPYYVNHSMMRVSLQALAVVAAVYLSGCAGNQRTERESERASRFGYRSTGTTTTTEHRAPPTPSTTATDTTTDVTVDTTTTTPPTQPGPAAPPPDATKKDYQYGTPVPGKPGFVTSPHAPYSGYVDVRGFPPGTEVKDPYTGKIFLVP
jgi:hypothetical protein